MFESIFTKLGASTKVTVGLSISPGIGLEMVEVDRATGTVNKYSKRSLEYNYSTREISDYEEFRLALNELFEELHIPKKSNIVLNIPSVHFGMIDLPILLTDEAITNAIISEVEQSYIFKRQEPVVSWTEIYSNINTENRALAYSAIQKNALDGISAVCNDIGCNIVGIENTYISLLRALSYSGLAKEQMREGTHWNLMIIGQNSYAILSMVDKKIIEYYEEPLALKSFVDDEIYNAITTSAKLTLAGLPASHLLIISETDLVSAEVLSMKLSIECAVSFIECNKYTQNELIPVNLNVLPNLAMKITLGVIGAGIYTYSDFPIKLNMVKEGDGNVAVPGDDTSAPTIMLGGMEFTLTPDFVKKMSLIFGAVLGVPLIIILLVLNMVLLPGAQTKLADLNAKTQQATDEIAKYTKPDNVQDAATIINNMVQKNKSILTYYEAIGISVPNKLWIYYIATNEAGKIDIKGKASDVESIYNFYKNLKQIVNNSDVKIYKLEVGSGSIDAVVSNTSKPTSYEFEITNMTEEELAPKAESKEGATTDAAAATSSADKSAGTASQPASGGSDSSVPGSEAGKSTGGDKLPNNLQKIEKF